MGNASLHLIRNPESGIRNLESGIRNPESLGSTAAQLILRPSGALKPPVHFRLPYCAPPGLLRFVVYMMSFVFICVHLFIPLHPSTPLPHDPTTKLPHYQTIFLSSRANSISMSLSSALKPATLEQAQEMGLRADEFDKIKEILGRTPNFTEMCVYSVMWSEHCSYKMA